MNNQDKSEIRAIVKEEMLNALYSFNAPTLTKDQTEYLSSQLKAYYRGDDITLVGIEDALDNLKNEPYFEIIQLYYQDCNTLENIADISDIDISTVTRNKKKLLKKLYSIIRTTSPIS